MIFCVFGLIYTSENLGISWYTWWQLIAQVGANNFNMFLELALFENQVLILKLDFLFFAQKMEKNLGFFQFFFVFRVNWGKILVFWARSLKLILDVYFTFIYSKNKKNWKKSQVFSIFWVKKQKIDFQNQDLIFKKG